MIRIISLSVLLISCWSVSVAQNDKPQTPLERRAADVCASFQAAPGGYEKFFATEFLTQVSPAQLTSIFTQYFSQLGRCTATKMTARQNNNAASFELAFEKGFNVAANISVNPVAPNLINGLWLGAPTSSSSSLADLVNELKALPGEKSFLVARLNDQGITPIVSHNPDRELAIGSAFKLYILSELAKEVNANQRKLSDVVVLDDATFSLPSGTLQTWPPGSPVTLHTLATFMISISDNTATDHLLKTLGRERVESVLAVVGHSKPELNEPFLSTLEMFKLKGDAMHKAAEQYLALDVDARRRFLAGQIAAIKREDAKPYADGKPAYVDRIEWFASVTDLCRVMDWLRRNTVAGKPSAALRDVLAINPGSGLNVSRQRWSYIGYKGGSEPGVLNMTYLLRSNPGQWYALSISWNDKDAPLDNSKVFALVQRALQIIE